jgi:hypothetical protein
MYKIFYDYFIQLSAEDRLKLLITLLNAPNDRKLLPLLS